VASQLAVGDDNDLGARYVRSRGLICRTALYWCNLWLIRLAALCSAFTLFALHGFVSAWSLDGLFAWYDVRTSVHSVFVRVFVLSCFMIGKLRKRMDREGNGLDIRPYMTATI
jgi:hypothetical protein